MHIIPMRVMRRFILLVVTAPIFWIYLGVTQFFYLILEGMGDWLELLGGDEEEDEAEEEK